MILESYEKKGLITLSLFLFLFSLFLNVNKQNPRLNISLAGMETALTSQSKVLINNAPWYELITVPGIGETLALRIVYYRKENGPFITFEDILNVKGIGPKKAIDMVKKHGNDFNSLFKEAKWEDFFDYDWTEVFSIFKELPVTEDYAHHLIPMYLSVHSPQ